ncbi:MAG TPA: Crp/Fnr family transcriptional regulator [Chitinophagaceae bacterium]|nr:Crp/Fnr family transcriptional regulator [Chitinophagaceae bacterium]
MNEKVGLTKEEEEIIRTYLIPKKIRKKQFLLQEGDVCRHIAFVEKGMLRAYTIGEKGTERIIQFAMEGWTISDLYSFLTSEPATYAIDAIENSELVLISQQANTELLEKLPRYETYMRILLTNAYIALQRRINSVISNTPEERYNTFTALYPEIVRRVPQHMIAAFMGLTPETLSRVRSKKARR